MPSAEHESPIALAKLDPELVAWLLADVFEDHLIGVLLTGRRRADSEPAGPIPSGEERRRGPPAPHPTADFDMTAGPSHEPRW